MAQLDPLATKRIFFQGAYRSRLLTPCRGSFGVSKIEITELFSHCLGEISDIGFPSQTAILKVVVAVLFKFVVFKIIVIISSKILNEFGEFFII